MVSLIGVVGTGKWNKVTYIYKGKSYETDFATYALYKLLEEDAIKFNKVVLFGTEESNWEIVQCDFGEKITKVIIPEGRNEEEIGEITRIFFENIPEGEIILDLTHGHRHHPILLLLISSYLDLIGKSKIVHTYYAMVPFGETQAEFFDLSLYLTIFETFFGLEIFRTTFYSHKLEEVEEELEEKAKNFKEKQALSEVRKVFRGIIGLSESLKINYAKQAIEKSETILKHAEKVKEIVEEKFPYFSPSLNLYLEEVSKIERLNGKSLWYSLLEFSKISLEKERYTSTMVLLREGLLGYGCYKLSACENKVCAQEIACSKPELRERITGLLDGMARKDLIAPNHHIEEVSRIYLEIQQLRNAMSHAFIQKNPPNIKETRNKIENIQNKYETLVES